MKKFYLLRACETQTYNTQQLMAKIKTASKASVSNTRVKSTKKRLKETGKSKA